MKSPDCQGTALSFALIVLWVLISLVAAVAMGAFLAAGSRLEGDVPPEALDVSRDEFD